MAIKPGEGKLAELPKEEMRVIIRNNERMRRNHHRQIARVTGISPNIVFNPRVKYGSKKERPPASPLGNYGVVYDVHMINVSGSARLQGYETMQAPEIKHYVAGEGFDSSDPSNKICNYYDSNNQKSNLGDRHMQVSFQTMARLTDDMGIAF